jgi:glyoxylase-like metal-dependent hydrolase (beta-lactamase superfamily II)
VVAHAADAPVITGAKPAPDTGLLRLTSTLVKTPALAAVDETLTADGSFSVPGFRVFHTPGHTAGHVSYLLDRGPGVLFVGDAAGGGRKPRKAPRLMAEDPAVAVASVKKLAELAFGVAVFGHGRAVTERAVDGFRELAARR